MRRLLIPFFAVTLGFAAAAQTIACSGINDAPIDTSEECAAYCDRAAECNEDVDTAECQADCNESMDKCLDSQKADARNELDECSDVACGDVVECSVDVGAECYFAIG